MELQKGPNILGPGGLLQAFAGAVKLFFFQFYFIYLFFICSEFCHTLE